MSPDTSPPEPRRPESANNASEETNDRPSWRNQKYCFAETRFRVQAATADRRSRRDSSRADRQGAARIRQDRSSVRPSRAAATREGWSKSSLSTSTTPEQVSTIRASASCLIWAGVAPEGAMTQLASGSQPSILLDRFASQLIQAYPELELLIGLIAERAIPIEQITLNAGIDCGVNETANSGGCFRKSAAHVLSSSMDTALTIRGSRCFPLAMV